MVPGTLRLTTWTQRGGGCGGEKGGWVGGTMADDLDATWWERNEGAERLIT